MQIVRATQNMPCTIHGCDFLTMPNYNLVANRNKCMYVCVYDVSKYLQKLKKASEGITERDNAGPSAEGGAISSVRRRKKNAQKNGHLLGATH